MSKSRKKIGLAPGTLVFTGNKKVDKSFSIVPSNKGFLITVIGEKIENNLMKQDYEIEKKYVDLFDIMLSEAK
ncbi:hypothetical protein [Gilvibacter sp.]|uniref:hypothetical protein n=1 Tax=Gilvibacter sp. TaxID=2729997 RepID=UPI003F4A0C3D